MFVKSLNRLGGSYARPQREITCAIVVTFRPDVRFPERLPAIARHARDITIVDNGSGPEFTPVLENAQRATGAMLISNPENRGVAAALNQGVDLALSRGFGWVLLLDQDSVVLEGLLEGARKAYDEFPEPNRIAVIGADHDHPFHYKKRKRYPGESSFREMRTVITSGSLLNTSLFKSIGPFREEMFIDSVDDEYCMRARDRGLSVIEATTFGIVHAIGHPKIVRLLGKPRSTSNHSHVRRYYMARNRLLLAARYLFKDPIWALYLTKTLIREAFFVALFEEQKIPKLRAILLGIYDAAIGKMGKLNEQRLAFAEQK